MRWAWLVLGLAVSLALALPGSAAPQAGPPRPVCMSSGDTRPVGMCAGGQDCDLAILNVCVALPGVVRVAKESRGIGASIEIQGTLPSGRAWSLTVSQPDHFDAAGSGLRRVCGDEACLLYTAQCAPQACTYQSDPVATAGSVIDPARSPLFLTGPLVELEAGNPADLELLKRSIFLAPPIAGGAPFYVQLAALDRGEAPSPRQALIRPGGGGPPPGGGCACGHRYR